MSKEKPSQVFRRGFSHLGETLSKDDLAVVLGFIVERQHAADQIVWQHLRAVATFAGIEEQVHISGKRYKRGTLIRSGSDVYIATRATAAPLTNSEHWLQFSEMGEPPKPASREKRRKKVTVTEHDARGRIRCFIEEWEREDE